MILCAQCLLGRREKKHQAQSQVWQFPWGTRQTLWQLLVTALICHEDNFALRDGDGARKPTKYGVPVTSLLFNIHMPIFCSRSAVRGLKHS